MQYREYRRFLAQPPDTLTWIASRVVVPLLRLLSRILPPLRRAMKNSIGALQGVVFHNRDRGDHQAAFSAAMQGVTRSRERVPNSALARHMADFHWWTFLDLAAQEAEHLGEGERGTVAGLVESASAPGGMLAAVCFRRVSAWRWKAGEHDDAIKLAKRAILADVSWPHGHILLGWFGLVSGRFDALPHLREALRVDPSCADSIRSNPDLAGAPGLMRALGLADHRAP